jgi:diguanylate cyclase (GGDEF)-like protein
MSQLSGWEEGPLSTGWSDLTDICLVRRFATTWLWAAHVAVVLAATAGYAMAAGPVGRAGAYLAASGLTTAAVVVGIRLHRPPSAAPWRVLVAGAVTMLTANAVWIGAPVVGRELPFPSLVDCLYLGAYGFVFVALVLVVRERTKGVDRFGFLDALIVATGLGALSWVFVVGPSLRQPGLGLAALAVSAAYPTVDLLLLGVAAWLLMSPGRRPPALWWLAVYVILQLFTDSAYAVSSLHGTFSQGSGLVAGWMLSYAALGAATLHPTVASLLRPGTVPRTSRGHLVSLIGAALVCPGTLIVQTLRGHDDDVVVLATLSAILFVFVLARVGGLMSDLAQRRRTEDSLRREARFVRLLHGATAAANDSEHLDVALRAVVDQICTEMAWSVGHAVIVDADLAAAGVIPGGSYCWASDCSRLVTLCQKIDETPLVDRDGLVARAAASAGPVWVHPLPTVNAPWLEEARRSGLRSAFGFAVRVDGEAVAVLQFLSDDDRAEDKALLAVAADIGTQLGRVVERVRARQALTCLAYQDVVTGLPNRPRLMQMLAAGLAPGGERAVAVLFCDLDDFKMVNDSLGHDVGDEVLVAFAGRLQRSLPAPEGACRLGGDEFAIVAAVDGEDDAEAMARAIVAAVEEPFTVGGRQFHISVSIGFAVGRPGAESPDELLRRADIALHHAKAAGKNRYEPFASGMLDRILARVEMEADLRAALDDEQFELYYQPKFCSKTGNIVGVEALLRWDHPRFGMVPPGEFIPLAEETGLIVPLGAWVLKQACQAGRRWQQAYRSPFTMAVNVSARQLQHPGLVEAVVGALACSELSPGDLILEITESSLDQELPRAAEQLLLLKQLGVQLAIDDFGAGHSSLDRLRRFPIDELKIDRSFVGEIRDASEPAPIVAAIVAMGHGLGHRVVAEGVETPAQLTFLGRHRCDQIQGYILARPMPAGELEAELDRRLATQPATRRSLPV